MLAVEREARAGSGCDAMPSSSTNTKDDDDGSQRSTPAADVTSISTPFARHIGRNKACASCRERKLKCDGHRPICGQCDRAWMMRKRSLKGKGLTEDDVKGMEKPCEYISVNARKGRGKAKDDVERSTGMHYSTDTLRDAQEECRRLERELKLANERIQAGFARPNFETFQPNQDELSIAQVLASTMRSAGDASAEERSSLVDTFGDHSTFTSFVEGLAQQAVVHDDGDTSIEDAGDPPEQVPDPFQDFQFNSSVNSSAHPGSSIGQADPLMELVLNGWPADFPAPSMVDALVRVFFDEVGYARLLFHPARFFQRLAQGPASLQFPHSAVLHAIFAVAFIVKPELDPLSVTSLSAFAGQSSVPRASSNDREDDVLDSQIKQRHSKSRSFADPAYQAGHKQGITMALQSRYDRERAKLGSAGYHSERAQYHLTIGMWEGGDLMSLARAAFMLTMKRYGCGELFDAWLSASISTRLCVALAINHSHPQAPTISELKSSKLAPVDTVRLAMTGAPGDWLEEEERRRLMFLVLLTDRSACAATLWANSLEEADITVELPLLRNSDFLRGDRAPAPDAPHQTLQSPDLFVKHHIDGFNTMIKAAVLMGRIAAFLSRLPSFATEEMMKANGSFDRLDNTLTAYALSLPFRATDPDEDGQIDIFRFVTYAILHTDTLMLHEPLLRLNEQSAAMCEAACRSVLDLLRILIAAGTSFARMPPVLILCLSTAGRVLVKRTQVVRERANAGTSETGDKAGAETLIDQLDFDIERPTPFTWSFTPGQSKSAAQTPAAGLGAPALSAQEERLRAEIDLIFTYLCKVGQVWPLARRHAQGLAQLLGIDVAAPEALEHGIFNERTQLPQQSSFA